MSAIMNRNNRVFSPQERERLQKQLRSLEARMLNKFDMPTNKNIKEQGLSDHRRGFMERFSWSQAKEDPAILKRQYERVKKALDAGMPHDLNKRERSKRDEQLKQDEEFLRRNMTPRNIYFAKPGTPEFEMGKKACKREMAPDIERVKQRYVQNIRLLDPDNAERNLVERLRPSS